MPAPEKFRPFKDPCRPKSEDPQLKVETLTSEELLSLLANTDNANEQSDSDDTGSS